MVILITNGGFMEEGKKKALELALSHIEKQFGDGAIMSLGKHSQSKSVQVIPTGSISIDLALGIGGVPRGRVVELYGPESSGKSTLAMHIVANCPQAYIHIQGEPIKEPPVIVHTRTSRLYQKIQDGQLHPAFGADTTDALRRVRAPTE